MLLESSFAGFYLVAGFDIRCHRLEELCDCDMCVCLSFKVEKNLIVELALAL